MQRLRDRLVVAEIDAIERVKAAGRRLRDAAFDLTKDERGQTPTEYLMIVGLMAAVIVVVFVTFYWQQVQQAAKDWVTKVKESILGTKIQG
ncbi:MAG: Flp family type IVb pilin [Vicinamibacterales bacterium]